MKLPRVDIYQMIVASALAVDIPLMMGAMLISKGLAAPQGFFYNEFPGIGLGNIGLVGNAVVGHRWLAPGTDKRLKWILGISWAISFSCIVFVLPLYLMTAATKETTVAMTLAELLPAVPATALGLLRWAYHLALIGVPHVCAPALLVISGVEQAAKVAKQEEVAAAETADRSEKLRKSVQGDTPTRIVDALADGSEMSAQQLHELLDIGYATVKKHSDRMTEEDARTKAPGLLAHNGGSPRLYRVAEAQLHIV